MREPALTRARIVIAGLLAGPFLLAAIFAALDGEARTTPFDMPEQGVKVCFVNLPNSQIELIEPLGENSTLAGFLAKNPLGGQHHLCFEVPDIAEARTALEALGKRILGPTRIGAHGTPIFFVHPKDMGGMLTEIMETPREDAHWSN